MQLLFLFPVFLGLITTFPRSSVTIGTNPINELSVENLREPLTLSLKTSSVTTQSRYSITTNEDGKKIIASLATELPAHTNLSIIMQPPSGALSAGKVSLSMNSSILVSHINRVAESNLLITYFFSSSELIAASIYSTTIHFTITD